MVSFYIATNATAERLSLETSFSERTVKRYLDALRTYNVVNTTHEQDFCNWFI